MEGEGERSERADFETAPDETDGFAVLMTLVE